MYYLKRSRLPIPGIFSLLICEANPADRDGGSVISSPSAINGSHSNTVIAQEIQGVHVV